MTDPRKLAEEALERAEKADDSCWKYEERDAELPARGTIVEVQIPLATGVCHLDLKNADSELVRQVEGARLAVDSWWLIPALAHALIEARDTIDWLKEDRRKLGRAHEDRWARINELKEALRFYANYDNYCDFVSYDGEATLHKIGGGYEAHDKADTGERARVALGEGERE
jgi:hypothetical protein